MDTLVAATWYVRGIAFGILLTVIVEFLVIHKSLYRFLNRDPPKDRDVPEDTLAKEPIKKQHKISVPHVHNAPWPPIVVDFIENSISMLESDESRIGTDPKAPPVITSPTEKCDWLNLICQRYFIELRASELFKEKTKRKISERINEKLRNNSFFSSFSLSDISLGEHAPQLSGVRVVKGLSDDLAVVLEFDMAYIGGANVTIDTVIAGGLKLTGKIFLRGLAGKLRLRCPSAKWSDMLGVSFAEDPGVDFLVDTPITVNDNQTVKDMVNSVLAKIVRKVFLETWVSPNWRNFYLPLLQPYPEQVLERLTMKPVPSRPPVPEGGRTSIARSVLTPVSNPRPIKSESQGDCLQDVFYSHDVLLTDQILPEYSRSLEAMFTQIALQDASTDVIEAQFKYKLNWRSVRNKNGINIEKARVILSTAHFSEITRATFTVPFEATMFLANPTHLSHIYDAFKKFRIVKQIDDRSHIRAMEVQFSRQNIQNLVLYDLRNKLADEKTFLILFRSIGGYGEKKEAEGAAKGAIYLYGYYISELPSGETKIIYLTQMSPEFAKYEVSWGQCLKLKTFIQQLYTPETGEEKKGGGRLKSVLTSTASMWTKARDIAGTSINRYLFTAGGVPVGQEGKEGHGEHEMKTMPHSVNQQEHEGDSLAFPSHEEEAQISQDKEEEDPIQEEPSGDLAEPFDIGTPHEDGPMASKILGDLDEATFLRQLHEADLSDVSSMHSNDLAESLSLSMSQGDSLLHSEKILDGSLHHQN